jgi:serine phosphatase RsbU (regulator of sigma subunit)/pSer/pThr/pTyr-binding forkhead associated (FHA) protein
MARDLTITTPDGQTQILCLEGSRLTVGRSETNQFACPDDNRLSRQHLVLEREGADWILVDLGSKNGTFVNGVRISGKTQLHPGDRIAAGKLLLVYDPAVAASCFVFEDKPAPEGQTITTTLAQRLHNEAEPRLSDKEGASRWVTPEAALLHAGRELALRRPLPELFRIILDLAMDAVGAQRGALLNCEKGTFTIQAVRGNDLRLSTAVRARVLEGKESLLIRDVERDILLHDRQSMLGSGIHSLLAVPIQTDDRVIGMIYLDTPAALAGFVTEDLNLLTVLANVAGIRIERERLAEIELADQVLAHDLEQAAEIQRHLLPVGTPAVEGLQLAGCNTPCRTVGGDYYDYLVYPDQKIALAIGDVAGKGMPAALLMSSLQAKVQAIAETSSSPAAVVARLNRSVAATCPDNRFVTFFFSLLNLRSGELAFCNAGHNPPLLARSDGRVERLEGGGPVLGILPGLSYQERSCVMEDGDMLLLYSDGVTEAKSPSDEEFGEERLEEILRKSRGESVEAVLAIVQEAVQSWTAGQPPADDITLVAARRAE